MQALDRRTIEEYKTPGKILMERAGKGVVHVLEQQFGSHSGQPVTIVCGKGNNGGDGLVIARLLKQRGAKIHVLLLAQPKDLTQDARGMYQRLRRVTPSSTIAIAPSAAAIHASTHKASLLIDAILGTGLSSAVREPYHTTIKSMNDAQAPTIAVDVPSGIHSDTGAILGLAINAHTTVTFGCPKIGLYIGKAVNHTGNIQTVDIGIPQTYIQELDVKLHLLIPESLVGLLPQRSQDSHKGTCGHTGLIAGSPGKTGSAALAAQAALRTGAGLVTIATPQSAQASLDAKLFEVMTLGMPETKSRTLSRTALKPLLAFAKERDAIALGPGISTHVETGKLIRQLLPTLTQHCVIDADGLNVLAEHLPLLSSCKNIPILTPHPGEMARLLGHTSAHTINQDRLGFAQNFANTHKVILVLKGARTIVAHPDGQTAICATGNPGMASAGMGDALTGVIVSFLAQGLLPWDAARAGVCLHGLAGDLAAKQLGQAGLIASDLIDHLPHALQYAWLSCREHAKT
ncbi:MAG: bifunctional NAD(P)H-hydrate repair enzyme Nnr [Nitrospirales bacterium]|nr:MAG: bifunctional NAD(P)H-hydrate repair enzyme Nnr [Nitrospirales bacterium]